MPALLVRAAAPADAAEIAAIYNEGIADRVATFESARADRRGGARLARRRPAVHRRHGRRRSRGLGAGRPVLRPLRLRRRRRARRLRRARARGAPRRPAGSSTSCARAAEAAGLYKLTSRIFADNESSIAAHTAAGFDVVGVQRRHGRLDGEWKDCVLVERLIGDAAAVAGLRPPPSARPSAGGRRARRHDEQSRRDEHRRAHRRRRGVAVVEQREEDRRQQRDADRVAELLDRVQRSRRRPDLASSTPARITLKSGPKTNPRPRRDHSAGAISRLVTATPRRDGRRPGPEPGHGEQHAGLQHLAAEARHERVRRARGDRGAERERDEREPGVLGREPQPELEEERRP